MPSSGPIFEDPEQTKPEMVQGAPKEGVISFTEPKSTIGSVLVNNSNVKHCGATETELNSLLSSGDNFSICLSAAMVFAGLFISTGVEWMITDAPTDIQKGVYPTLMACSLIAIGVFGYLTKTLKNPSKELVRKIVNNEPR